MHDYKRKTVRNTSVNTCSPDKHNSGMSPPPLADSLLMFALKTSALVVIIKGPNPGYRIGGSHHLALFT